MTMIRCLFWPLMIAVLASQVLGCTSMFSKRVIEQFAENMQAQNLDGLKGATSEDFEQRALRQDDAAKGLKMLKIPTGKVEIVSVEELDKGKRKVLVKVGEKESAKDVEYHLTKNGRSWVVDDVVLKQDTGGGAVVERSVTEQMDLLLTCRELLITWRGGTRDEKLAFCSEDLQTQLKPIPATWFEKLSKDIAGPARQSTFKPDARMNGQKAFVVVPHPQGSLYLEMHQNNRRWILHDLAIEPTSKDSTGIRALSKVVFALNRSAEFLSAYQDQNRDALSGTATKNFYSQCLSGADFEEIPLPIEQLLADSYEARQFTDGTQSIKRVELLLKHNDTTYMLTLREEEPKNADGTKGNGEFRVDEVTMFEKGDQDVRRMSAVFLTHAVVNVYVNALRERDLVKLKELSSTNFCDRVWNRPESSHFAIMTDPELPAGEMEVVATNFRGDVSEVTVDQGGTPLTLVLHTARGSMVIDDVLLPAMNKPSSLKASLEALLTVQAFHSALLRNDLSGLIKHSADGLDRIAWRQLSEAPQITQQFQRPLRGEVISIQLADGMSLIRTSDGRIQCEIQLVKEGEQFVVYDVALVEKENPERRLEMMQMLRKMIAEGSIGPAAQRRAENQQAGFDATRQQARQVQKADFEPLDPNVYTK